MKVFVIDVSICNGCYNCQIACKDEHVGNDWMPYARPQPDTGQFWLKLNEHICGTVPKVKMHYIPVLCQHCDDAPCIPACPIDGTITRRDDGLVLINPATCSGCKSCIDACPYGAIFLNEDLNIAQKCTGCAHLLDGGEWTVPRCVDACPTEALKFGEETEFKDLIAGAEVLKPECGTGPRVYYMNIPKRWVAGTVYDPIEKECIQGATCTLKGGGLTLTATTDNYGDFWLKDLPDDGTFELKIEATGFAVKIFENISTEKDLNLGDIPLNK